MPVFHIGGTGWGVMGLYNGARGVVGREFNANQALECIEKERITKMFMVPAAIQLVLRHPRARQIDYSCMRYLFYGASPISLELLKEAVEVFGCGFIQLYGMTETCGSIVALPPEDHSPLGSPKMLAAGKPLPGVEIAIVDADGNSLARQAVGEIVTRSISNMSGYWRLPEATAQALDAEGWLHTGDVGYLDAEGYLYIVDRLKDLIISGGENIYPAEVERAVAAHPAVAEVAVIGVPDVKWGEAVLAVVVVKPDVLTTESDILQWVRERIATYKVPKHVQFIASLPRNASGKVLKRVLREPYWHQSQRRVN
jgi:long-chain acyl-CoA synthetase